MHLKHLFISIVVSVTTISSIAQPSLIKEINNANKPDVALAPLRYLASDELKGRNAARPEIDVAAKYISDQFKSFGLKQVVGTTDFYQTFSINLVSPAKSGTFTIGDKKYAVGTDIQQMGGKDITINAPVVYVGYGMKEDLKKANVKGMIVISDWGGKDATSAFEGLNLLDEKVKLAKEYGALALILRSPSDMPWEEILQLFTNEHPQPGDSPDFSNFIINDKDKYLPSIQSSIQGSLTATGNEIKNIPAKNLMGWVEGTDPNLKSQFIVLSAHYDHLGVAPEPKMEEGKMDSIYNGARDNAIGTTAVIDAARYFASHPPKRSILFIAYTAEEMGLVGSKYFAAHPTLPLKQMVYNLNIDNASYNDTSVISLVGVGRTSADEDIKKACAAYGMSILPDPTPDGSLFYGSDNLPLAEKGIPAPTFSLGMKTFDQTIFNRYHQLSDEVGNFNLTYAMKFINAYILAAKYIADDPSQPKWTKGDKYEATSKQLYQ